MHYLVIECLVDEDPNDVVLKIKSSEDLPSPCGLVALHVRSENADDPPRLGIELG
jgi:hypothetical protein